MCSWLGSQEALHERVLTLDEALEALLAVTPEQVQDLAGRLIHDELLALAASRRAPAGAASNGRCGCHELRPTRAFTGPPRHARHAPGTGACSATAADGLHRSTAGGPRARRDAPHARRDAAHARRHAAHSRRDAAHARRHAAHARRHAAHARPGATGPERAPFPDGAWPPPAGMPQAPDGMQAPGGMPPMVDSPLSLIVDGPPAPMPPVSEPLVVTQPTFPDGRPPMAIPVAGPDGGVERLPTATRPIACASPAPSTMGRCPGQPTRASRDCTCAAACYHNARAALEQMAGAGTLDREALADLAETRWRSGDLEGAAEAAEAHLDARGDEPIARSSPPSSRRTTAASSTRGSARRRSSGGSARASSACSRASTAARCGRPRQRAGWTRVPRCRVAGACS